MKMIAPVILIITSNNLSLFMVLLSMLMMFSCFNFKNMIYMNIFNNFMSLDYLSLILSLLSLLSVILILLSSNNFMNIKNSMMFILLFLMLSFMSNNMFLFYIFFEMVLIPTLLLITKSGPQPERLQAAIYFLIYTVIASLPLLVLILNIPKTYSFFYTSMISMNFPMMILFILAFLVKMPMFLFHLWLPKAHVEAPVEGSMILAAVLLKLGGYGIMRFSPYFLPGFSKINCLIISISMMGMLSSSMLCTRQKDLKALIAYSSVGHMAMVLASLLIYSPAGLTGAMIMLFAHGMASSALFLLVNMVYSQFHTRNISLFKGLMNLFPNITFWWFIFIATNIAAPPSINLLSEILMISSLSLWNMNNMILLTLSILMTSIFSIMLFISLSHNKSYICVTFNSSSKLFLSLFIHLSPLMLFILKLDMF